MLFARCNDIPSGFQYLLENLLEMLGPAERSYAWDPIPET